MIDIDPAQSRILTELARKEPLQTNVLPAKSYLTYLSPFSPDLI